MVEVSKRELIESIATGSFEDSFLEIGLSVEYTKDVMEYVGDIISEKILSPSSEIIFNVPDDSETYKLV